MYSIKRVSTGVEELDRALEGGVPRGSWVAITGEPGTGKSILCMHYAYRGLVEGDPVIYVTTEAEFRDVIRQAEQFNMYFSDYEIHYLGGEPPIRRPNIVVIDIFSLLKTARQLTSDLAESERRRRFAALDIDTLIAAITNAYEVLGVVSEGRRTPSRHVRLIIDSLSAFWADKPAMARKYSYQLKIATHRENVTAFLVSQYAMTTKSVADYEETLIKVGDKVHKVCLHELMNRVSDDYEQIILINPNIKVLSYDPLSNNATWRRVKAVIKHRCRKYLINLELSNGLSLSLTNDHGIYVNRYGRTIVIKPTEIRKDDKLIVINKEGQLRLVSIKGIYETLSDCMYVYDLSVEGTESFFVGNSNNYVLVHNSTFGFGLEHIADGVIHLWMDNVEQVKEVKRYLIIKKMRMTNHYTKAFRLYVEPGKGIVLERISG